MKLVAWIAITLCAGALAACTTAGPYGSTSQYQSSADLGGCAKSPINPHRQDQICNRQNGNPYGN